MLELCYIGKQVLDLIKDTSNMLIKIYHQSIIECIFKMMLPTHPIETILEKFLRNNIQYSLKKYFIYKHDKFYNDTISLLKSNLSLDNK